MKIITLVSAKGGVGRTTLCANLCTALHQQGHSVVAVDFAPQNALHLHMGISPAHSAGLVPNWLGHLGAKSARTLSPTGITVIPHGVISEIERRELEDRLHHESDWLLRCLDSLDLDDNALVFIDTPPGPSVYVEQAVAVADMVLVVGLADAASYACLPLTENLIDSYHTGNASTLARVYVINQVDQTKPLARDVTVTLQNALFDQPVVLIHQDNAVSEALASADTVLRYDPHCQATRDFTQTAAAILTQLGIEGA